MLAALLLGGCGAKESIPAAVPVSLEDKVFAACKDIGELIRLPAGDLTDLIGIEQEDIREAYWLGSSGLDGREILAIRALDTQAALRAEELLKGYLEQRRQEAKNYLPEVYQLLTDTDVARKNCTLVLCVGADAKAETKALLDGE